MTSVDAPGPLTDCPACESPGLTAFYRVDGVPVNSCVLMSNAGDARAYPRADLELAVCSQCGFITNVRFDSRHIAYSAEYEDQQSFSATFSAFAERLAGVLGERFELHDKDIVEIGCGKGDFLRLLCANGRNRGTGIDPSISPRQFGSDAADDIHWVAEFLNPEHRRFAADFYCCRHTLEHIPDVLDFVRVLKEVIGERAAPLFLEVPDTERVLTSGAFEDIYHEHCSYFTAGSLKSLMQRAGFSVSRVYREYSDQYLMLEAGLSMLVQAGSESAETDTESILTWVEDFSRMAAAKKDYWAEVFEKHSDRSIAIWGSGSKCVSLLSSLKPETEPIHVVDINPHRHGKFMPGSGIEIQAPEALQRVQPGLVIAMNSIYLDEIQTALDDLSIAATLLGL